MVFDLRYPLGEFSLAPFTEDIRAASIRDLAELPAHMRAAIDGLSDAQLDTPWPKVEALTMRMDEALKTADSVDALSSLLFGALGDRSPADDEDLPDTGVPREWEKMLSAAFIRTRTGRRPARGAAGVVRPVSRSSGATLP